MTKAEQILSMVSKLGSKFGEADIQRYFGAMTTEDIAPQRTVKNELSARLRSSVTRPQVVTVRKNGDNPEGSFMILPLEVVEELLLRPTQDEKGKFVPITQLLRDSDGLGGLKLPKRPPSKRASRPKRPAIAKTIARAAVKPEA